MAPTNIGGLVADFSKISKLNPENNDLTPKIDTLNELAIVQPQKKNIDSLSNEEVKTEKWRYITDQFKQSWEDIKGSLGVSSVGKSPVTGRDIKTAQIDPMKFLGGIWKGVGAIADSTKSEFRDNLKRIDMGTYGEANRAFNQRLSVLSKQESDTNAQKVDQSVAELNSKYGITDEEFSKIVQGGRGFLDTDYGINKKLFGSKKISYLQKLDQLNKEHNNYMSVVNQQVNKMEFDNAAWYKPEFNNEENADKFSEKIKTHFFTPEGKDITSSTPEDRKAEQESIKIFQQSYVNQFLSKRRKIADLMEEHGMIEDADEYLLDNENITDLNNVLSQIQRGIQGKGVRFINDDGTLNRDEMERFYREDKDISSLLKSMDEKLYRKEQEVSATISAPGYSITSPVQSIQTATSDLAFGNRQFNKWIGDATEDSFINIGRQNIQIEAERAAGTSNIYSELGRGVAGAPLEVAQTLATLPMTGILGASKIPSFMKASSLVKNVLSPAMGASRTTRGLLAAARASVWGIEEAVRSQPLNIVINSLSENKVNPYLDIIPDFVGGGIAGVNDVVDEVTKMASTVADIAKRSGNDVAIMALKEYGLGGAKIDDLTKVDNIIDAVQQQVKIGLSNPSGFIKSAKMEKYAQGSEKLSEADLAGVAENVGRFRSSLGDAADKLVGKTLDNIVEFASKGDLPSTKNELQSLASSLSKINSRATSKYDVDILEKATDYTTDFLLKNNMIQKDIIDGKITEADIRGLAESLFIGSSRGQDQSTIIRNMLSDKGVSNISKKESKIADAVNAGKEIIDESINKDKMKDRIMELYSALGEVKKKSKFSGMNKESLVGEYVSMINRVTDEYLSDGDVVEKLSTGGFEKVPFTEIMDDLVQKGYSSDVASDIAKMITFRNNNGMDVVKAADEFVGGSANKRDLGKVVEGRIASLSNKMDDVVFSINEIGSSKVSEIVDGFVSQGVSDQIAYSKVAKEVFDKSGFVKRGNVQKYIDKYGVDSNILQNLSKNDQSAAVDYVLSKIMQGDLISALSGGPKGFKPLQDVVNSARKSIIDIATETAKGRNIDDFIDGFIWSISSNKSVDQIWNTKADVLSKVSSVGEEYLTYLIRGDNDGFNPSIDFVSNMITKAMSDDKPDLSAIPTSYLWGVGKQVLFDHMGVSTEDVNGYNKLLSSIEGELQKRGRQARSVMEYMKGSYSNGSINIGVDGSLIDKMNQAFDTRKSVGQIGLLEGGVDSRSSVSLLRYSANSDRKYFSSVLEQTLGNYFGLASKGGIDLKETTIAKLGSDPAKYFTGVVDQVIDTIKSQGVAEYMDEVERILMDVDEYISFAVEGRKSPVENILGQIQRRTKNETVRAALSNYALTQEEQEIMMRFMDRGYSARNKVSRIFNDEISKVIKKSGSIPMSSDDFTRFLYKNIGNNISILGSDAGKNVFTTAMSTLRDNIIAGSTPESWAKINNLFESIIYKIDEDIQVVRTSSEDVDYYKKVIKSVSDLVDSSSNGDSKSILMDQVKMVEDALNNQVDRNFPLIDYVVNGVRSEHSKSLIGELDNIDDVILATAQRKQIEEVMQKYDDIGDMINQNSLGILSESPDVVKGQLLEMGVPVGEVNKEYAIISSAVGKVKSGKANMQNVYDIIASGGDIFSIMKADRQFARGIREMAGKSIIKNKQTYTAWIKGNKGYELGYERGSAYKFLGFDLFNFVTPSQASQFDPGLASILNDIQEGKKSTITIIDSIDGKKTKNISFWMRDNKSKMYDIISKNNISSESIKNVHNAIAGNTSSVLKLNDQEKELFDYAKNYLDNVQDFRRKKSLGEISYSDIDKYRKDNFTDPSQFVERLGGNWVFMNSQKYNELSSYYDGVRGYVKNIALGAMGEKTGSWIEKVGDAVSSFAIKAYVAKNYLLPVALHKGAQQVGNNIMTSVAGITSLGINSNTLDELTSAISTEDIGFDLFKSDQFWSDDMMSKKSPWGRVVEFVTQDMNALVWADKLSMGATKKYSIGLALYDGYNKFGGESYLKYMSSNVSNLYDVMKANGIESLNEFHNGKAVKKILESGSDVDVAKITDFYHQEYLPLLERTRQNLASFYVADNIREFNFVPVTQGRRFLFGLMKWATAKTGEYSLKIAESVRNAEGLTGASKFFKIIEHPVYSHIAMEIANAARIHYKLDSASDGDGSIPDINSFMEAMVVPVAAFGMTFGKYIFDPVKKGISDFSVNHNIMNAVVTSMLESFNSIMSSAGVYENSLLNEAITSWNTAEADKRNDTTQKLVLATIKNVFGNMMDTYSKFSKLNFQGYKYDVPTSSLGIVSTFLTNTESDYTTNLRKNIEKIWMLSSYGANPDDKLSDGIEGLLNRLPIIGTMKSNRTNNNALVDIHNEYVKQNGLSKLFDPYSKKQIIREISQKYSDNYYKNSEKWKAVMLSKGMTKDQIDSMSPDVFMKFAIQNDIYEKRSPIYKSVVSGFESDSSFKDIVATVFANTDPTIEGRLSSWFENKNNNPGDPKQLQRFIAYSQSMGGVAAYSQYLKMYVDLVDEKTKESIWGKGKKGDAAYKVSKDLVDDKYIAYVKEMNRISNDVVVDSWDILGREKYVGNQLMMDYIKVDKNYPLEKDKDSILKIGKNGLSTAIYLNTMSDVAKNQGIGQIMNVTSAIALRGANIISYMDQKTPEAIEKARGAFGSYNEILGSLSDGISSGIMTRSAAAMAKMGMAIGILPSAEKLVQLSQEEFDKTINILGKENVERAINIVTDSMPTAMEEAYHQVTGKDVSNLGSGDGKGRGKGGIRLPKLTQQKEEEIRATKNAIGNINKMVDLLPKLTKRGLNFTPQKFKYESTGGTQPTLKATVVKIPTYEEQLQGLGDVRVGRTEQGRVEVKSLPTKSARTITSKYRTRAIKNANSNTRNIK